MAVTDPIAWAGGEPLSESWVIENADIAGPVSTTGVQQILSQPWSRWRAKMTYQFLREEVLWLRAAVASRRGRAGLWIIGPADLFGAPQPVGALDRWAFGLNLIPQRQSTLPIRSPVNATVVGSAAKYATSLVLRMSPYSTPTAGNYIGIGGRLHVLTSAVQGIPDTDFACTIEPRLRAPAANGAAVTFTAATTLMRLMTPVDGLPVTGGDHLTSVSLDFVEHLP